MNLREFFKEPRGKLFAIDLDGTLCEGEFWGNTEPKPMKKRIELINGLYRKGAHIIIYTARDSKWFTETQAWLIKHGVMHHGISMMRKPGADIYVDDKSVSPDDFFGKEPKKVVFQEAHGGGGKMGEHGGAGRLGGLGEKKVIKVEESQIDEVLGNF